MTKVGFEQLVVGDKARITGLLSGSAGYRQRLLAVGLLPGTEFTLKRIAPMGCPIELKVGQFSVSVRKHEASILQLERD